MIGVIWAINTGRSVDLLESGLADFEFPIHPDFILTSERDVFRPSSNGGKWEPYGDWNERVARDHAELYHSAESVLAEVVDFVNQKTKARLLYHTAGLEGLVAESEEELDRVTKFIDQARREAAEVSLPAQHRLPAVLSRRLSQRARPSPNCRACSRFRGKKFLPRAIIITTSRCSTAVSRNIPPAPPMRFRR